MILAWSLSCLEPVLPATCPTLPPVLPCSTFLFVYLHLVWYCHNIHQQIPHLDISPSTHNLHSIFCIGFYLPQFFLAKAPLLWVSRAFRWGSSQSAHSDPLWEGSTPPCQTQIGRFPTHQLPACWPGTMKGFLRTCQLFKVRLLLKTQQLTLSSCRILSILDFLLFSHTTR